MEFHFSESLALTLLSDCACTLKGGLIGCQAVLGTRTLATRRLSVNSGCSGCRDRNLLFTQLVRGELASHPEVLISPISWPASLQDWEGERGRWKDGLSPSILCCFFFSNQGHWKGLELHWSAKNHVCSFSEISRKASCQGNWGAGWGGPHEGSMSVPCGACSVEEFVNHHCYHNFTLTPVGSLTSLKREGRWTGWGGEIERRFFSPSYFKHQIMLDIWIFPQAHFHKIMPNYPERVAASQRDFWWWSNKFPHCWFSEGLWRKRNRGWGRVVATFWPDSPMIQATRTTHLNTGSLR